MNKKLNRNPIIINITGTNGKTITARLIERVLSLRGLKVGLACSVGLYLNGKRVQKHDRSGPVSFNFLATKSEDLDVIVCENVLRHIRENHFYPAPADICLITNISDDHVHQTKSGTVTEIAEIKGKLIKRNKLSGVTILNKDNKYTKLILDKFKPKNVILFGLNKDITLSYPHKFLYYVKDNAAFQSNHGKEIKTISDIAKVPITLGGKLEFNIYNLLAAVCVLDNLPDVKIDKKQLEEALNAIKLDFTDLPGRFNIFDFGKFTVILDDAHNPESYRRAFLGAKMIKHKRLISVLKASSSRSTKFIRELGRIAGMNSQVIYVKESFAKNSKKRKIFGGKVATLLIDGISSTMFDTHLPVEVSLSGTKTGKIYKILDEEEAVKTAIKNAREGDLILIFGYRIDKLNNLITNLNNKITQ